MIVSCERCGTQYRVREDKLPAGGGRIRCPGCAHVFVVRPPGSESSSSLSMLARLPPANTTTESSVISKLPNTDPFFDSKPKEDDNLPKAQVRRRGRGAGRRSAPKLKPLAESPNLDLGGSDFDEDLLENNPPPKEGEDLRTWKLRRGGLTYAFHSIDSLQQWLEARDSLDDVELSREGEDWGKVSKYKEILTPKIRLKLDRPDDSSLSDSEEKSGPVLPPSATASARRASVLAMSAVPQPKNDSGGLSVGGRTLSRPSLKTQKDVPRSKRASASSAGARKKRRKGKRKTKSKSISTGPRKSFLGILALCFVVAIIGHMSGILDLSGVVPFLDKEYKSEGISSETKGLPKSGTHSGTDTQKNPRTPRSPRVKIVKDFVLPPGDTAQEREVALRKLESMMAKGGAVELGYGLRILNESLIPNDKENIGHQQLLAKVHEGLGNPAKATEALNEVQRLEDARDAAIKKRHEDTLVEARGLLKEKEYGEALSVLKKLRESDLSHELLYTRLIVGAYSELNQKSRLVEERPRLEKLERTQQILDVEKLISEKAFNEALSLLKKSPLSKERKSSTHLQLLVNIHTGRGTKADLKRLNTLETELAAAKKKEK